MRCSLGVGCDEYGVCYADAHGEPDRCGCHPQENQPMISISIEPGQANPEAVSALVVAELTRRVLVAKDSREAAIRALSHSDSELQRLQQELKQAEVWAGQYRADRVDAPRRAPNPMPPAAPMWPER